LECPNLLTACSLAQEENKRIRTKLKAARKEAQYLELSEAKKTIKALDKQVANLLHDVELKSSEIRRLVRRHT
jgi:hypothetical protein